MRIVRVVLPIAAVAAVILPPAQPVAAPPVRDAVAAVAAAAPPASHDLSQYAPPPGDQGGVDSCISWALVHTAMGLLMNQQRITGGPLAPMYIYSQIAHGTEAGTSVTTNLAVAKAQGAPSRSVYTQGDTDYTTQPTDAQRQNAARYRISSYTKIPLDSGAQNALKTAVSQGLPVIVTFQSRVSFSEVTAANPVYNPGKDGADPPAAGHAVVALGYDQNSVKFENSWGADWGANGFATMPWSFLLSSGDVESMYVVGPLVTS